MFKRAWVGAMLLVACGGADDASFGGEAQTNLAARCAARDIAHCAEDARCAPFGGERLDMLRQCIGASQAFACVEKPLGCDDALGLVQDANGHRYRVGGICDVPGVDYLEAAWTSGTPEIAQLDWPQCDPSPPALPTACAERSGDACEQDRPDCVAIQATAFDAVSMCMRGAKKVGCMPKTESCTEAISYGRDREGQTWQFGSGCQPAGFTAIYPRPDELPQSSWSGCRT